MKATTPRGQLPIMELDEERVITQSGAMARWAARRDPTGTLYPVDADKCFVIDELIHMLDDDARDFMPGMYMGMRPTAFGMPEDFGKTEEGQARIKELRQKYQAEALPKSMNLLVAQLKRSGGPFLTGADLTLADLFWLPRVRYLQSGICDHLDPKCLVQFPEILAWQDAMMNVPVIAKHYEK